MDKRFLLKSSNSYFLNVLLVESITFPEKSSIVDSIESFVGFINACLLRLLAQFL